MPEGVLCPTKDDLRIPGLANRAKGTNGVRYQNVYLDHAPRRGLYRLPASVKQQPCPIEMSLKYMARNVRV